MVPIVTVTGGCRSHSGLQDSTRNLALRQHLNYCRGHSGEKAKSCKQGVPRSHREARLRAAWQAARPRRPFSESKVNEYGRSGRVPAPITGRYGGSKEQKRFFRTFLRVWDGGKVLNSTTVQKSIKATQCIINIKTPSIHTAAYTVCSSRKSIISVLEQENFSSSFTSIFIQLYS